MSTEDHRSFRLTHCTYMHGRRVKRHLLWVSITIKMVAVVFGIAATVLIRFIPYYEFIQRNPTPEEWRMVVLASYSIGIVVFWGMTRLCLLASVGLGLLTRNEARDFPWGRHWPDSWREVS